MVYSRLQGATGMEGLLTVRIQVPRILVVEVARPHPGRDRRGTKEGPVEPPRCRGVVGLPIQSITASSLDSRSYSEFCV